LYGIDLKVKFYVTV